MRAPSALETILAGTVVGAIGRTLRLEDGGTFNGCDP